MFVEENYLVPPPPLEHLGSQVKLGFPFVIGVVQLHLYVLEIYFDSLSLKQGA
jgi:hypothetical protein